MKKNFKKIPDFIINKITTFENDNFVVACVFRIDKNNSDFRKFEKLNLVFIDGVITFNASFVPLNGTGTYSKRNIEGYRIVHRDRQKILKILYLGERPIFGDWFKGSFSLFVPRKVFPYDQIPPREWTINTELIDETEHEFIVKVGIDVVFNKNMDFREELFFAINLLQENIYSIDVFESTSTREDYLRSLTLTWEIFPPGEIGADIERIVGNRNLGIEEIEQIRRTFEYIYSLNPDRIIYGISGMRRYFGAKFTENLVVFENLNYGNAVYVLFNNWEELSRLSRTEIQSRPSDEYIRIKHIGNWQQKLERIIKDKRLV
ncbi:MAG: hypothetical protein ACM3MI_14490 [Clostridiales bacterium]